MKISTNMLILIVISFSFGASIPLLTGFSVFTYQFWIIVTLGISTGVLMEKGE